MITEDDIMKDNNIHGTIVETDCLRAVQILLNTVQKWGKIMQIRRKKFSQRMKKYD